MRIVFVGESDAREIAGGIVAAHGVPVDVPDDVARSLLEQSVFEAADAATEAVVPPAEVEAAPAAEVEQV